MSSDSAAGSPDPDPDELELIRESGAVLRMGRMTLGAGTGAYRVKASMRKVAHALGIERQEARVAFNEIAITSHRGPSFRTEVAVLGPIGVDTDRLAELERTADDLAARAARQGRAITVEEVTGELDRVAARPSRHPAAINALAAGVACGAFAFLSSGGPVEVVASVLGATLGQGLRRALLRRHWNQFGVTMLAATAALLGYLVLVGVLQAAGMTGPSHEIGYLSAVLFLIPGFPLVTAALDIAKLDLSSGIARLVYATTILVSASVAVWVVSSLVGLEPALPDPIVLPDGVLLALRVAASFVGVAGFAVMFNSPWRMAVAAGAIAVVPNVGRLLLVDHGMTVQAAAAIAALLVGLLAAVVAPRLRVPRITLSVPGVLIMVPGPTAYRAVYHVASGEVVEALGYAAQAALVVLALAVGLAVARMLTDREWGIDTPSA